MSLFIGLPILAIAAIVVIYLASTRSHLSYTFVPATTGDIKSEVRASGAVQAASDVQLAFQRSGKVAQTLVKVGDTVKAGQTLATLDVADLQAQLAQAQAGYDAQNAKLQDMKNGASGADLNLSQAQVSSATQAAQDAENNLNNVKAQAQISLNNQYSHSVDLINSAYSAAFDAVNAKLADLFTDQQTDNPKLTFNTTDGQMENTVKGNITVMESSLSAWNGTLTNLDPTDYPGTDQALTNSLTNLNNLADFLRQVNLLLSYSVTSPAFSQATLNLEKANVNAGLANVNAAILALNGQKQAIAATIATNKSLVTQAASQLDQANNAVIVAQKAQALKKAGATSDQIAAQAAAVAQAQATVQNVQVQLNNSVVTAPLDGLISQNDAKSGEIISPNVPIISIISQAKYQIVVQISEANIANIKLGQKATVTTDAYGPDKTFEARVIIIEPASTLVNGVASYKVTLEFSQLYPEIKAGLSANVQILTGENQSALVVPASAVIKRGDQNYVIVDNGTATGAEREVTTGITSLNGEVEITSGLQAGERVVTFGSALN
jgi:HlyD family secretion protein